MVKIHAFAYEYLIVPALSFEKTFPKLAPAVTTRQDSLVHIIPATTHTALPEYTPARQHAVPAPRGVRLNSHREYFSLPPTLGMFYYPSHEVCHSR